jgi:hypothetical protein
MPFTDTAIQDNRHSESRQVILARKAWPVAGRAPLANLTVVMKKLNIPVELQTKIFLGACEPRVIEILKGFDGIYSSKLDEAKFGFWMSFWRIEGHVANYLQLHQLQPSCILAN